MPRCDPLGEHCRRLARLPQPDEAASDVERPPDSLHGGGEQVVELLSRVDVEGDPRDQTLALERFLELGGRTDPDERQPSFGRQRLHQRQLALGEMPRLSNGGDDDADHALWRRSPARTRSSRFARPPSACDRRVATTRRRRRRRPQRPSSRRRRPTPRRRDRLPRRASASTSALALRAATIRAGAPPSSTAARQTRSSSNSSASSSSASCAAAPSSAAPASARESRPRASSSPLRARRLGARAVVRSGAEQGSCFGSPPR